MFYLFIHPSSLPKPHVSSVSCCQFELKLINTFDDVGVNCSYLSNTDNETLMFAIVFLFGKCGRGAVMIVYTECQAKRVVSLY